MQVHFFTRINTGYRDIFRDYSTQLNLRAVKIVSLIYFLLNITLRLFVVASDIPVQHIKHYDEINSANILASIFTPLFAILSMMLIAQYERGKPKPVLSQLLVLVFGLFILLSGMRATFFAMHNPRNTLLMYLIGVVVTGTFFTFEFYETIILTVTALICFNLILPYYQEGTSEILMNNLGSLIILVVFYAISRFSFSYRADNYLKLKAIEEKNMEIETASRLKNEILGIVAHDLRNPLTVIRALTSIMEDDRTLNEDNQENVQMIKASCDKANTIINDLIETAHNDKDNVFDIEEVELNQYLLRIVDEWAKNKTGNTSILYYGTNKPIYTHINTEKMQRVMDNLISNAVKFSKDGDHVEIRLRVDDFGQIFFDIKDFGMGIPETMLPYIFDRFSRA
ncbi:MAG TPA: HAMP domain-containing sensor histidine kinase, partial [Mucilaginibacter sp.]|nr:HAMP domain-containing sensor histidine kinase [Mucilaginibacter sp.]